MVMQCLLYKFINCFMSLILYPFYMLASELSRGSKEKRPGVQVVNQRQLCCFFIFSNIYFCSVLGCRTLNASISNQAWLIIDQPLMSWFLN